MATSLTLKQLIRQTYLKILRDCLICLLLFYLIPASLSSVSGITPDNVNRFALFFNVTSWIYLCLLFIGIIIHRIRLLLSQIQKELNIVYHESLYLEPTSPTELQIEEFIQTNQHLNLMQEKIQNMLKEEQAQKQELMFQVAAAAHDLKTPLTVIKGNAEYLQTLSPAPAFSEPLQDLETASNQLDHYFNQFIHYSKTFYTNSLETERISTQDLTQHIEELLSPHIPNQVQFHVKNGTAITNTLQLNRNLVDRALLNLVNNALHYQDGPTPQISITLSEVSTAIVAKVWNNHSHFSEALLEHAGQLFYQENPARTASKEQHHGLGLAFVKRVMKLHHGKMELGNTEQGAYVNLYFPKQEEKTE